MIPVYKGKNIASNFTRSFLPPTFCESSMNVCGIKHSDLPHSTYSIEMQFKFVVIFTTLIGLTIAAPMKSPGSTAVTPDFFEKLGIYARSGIGNEKRSQSHFSTPP